MQCKIKIHWVRGGLLCIFSWENWLGIWQSFNSGSHIILYLNFDVNSHNCSQVAAAKDYQTAILIEDGFAYTFGLNVFYQLRIILPLFKIYVPKYIHFSFKTIRWLFYIKPIWTKSCNVDKSTYFSHLTLPSMLCVISHRRNWA